MLALEGMQTLLFIFPPAQPHDQQAFRSKVASASAKGPALLSDRVGVPGITTSRPALSSVYCLFFWSVFGSLDASRPQLVCRVPLLSWSSRALSPSFVLQTPIPLFVPGYITVHVPKHNGPPPSKCRPGFSLAAILPYSERFRDLPSICLAIKRFFPGCRCVVRLPFKLLR